MVRPEDGHSSPRPSTGAPSLFCDLHLTYLVRLGDLDRRETIRDTTVCASEDVEPAKLLQQILCSNKVASEKAEDLLLEREVNEMGKDEWRGLLAGIHEDVKRVSRLRLQLENLAIGCIARHGF
ncbi:hypothetical protein WJX77_011949 [Trebouxia sp. C0004]